MIASVLNWIAQFFQNALNVVLGFLSNLFGAMMQGLISFLKVLFRPVLILIAMIFYFVFKLGELVIALFAVLLGIGKLLFAFVMGLFNTLAGFTWTPTTPNHGSWSTAIGEVFTGLAVFQLDKIAYVLLFVIWVTTAVSAIRMLTAAGGGDD